FAVDLRLLPAAGAADPAGLVLPSVTLALFSVGFIARQTRGAMLEVMRLDYVRTARAKGAARGTVLLKHALRTARLPAPAVVRLFEGAEASEVRRRGVVRSLLSHRSALAGLTLLALYVAGTFLGPLLMRSNPTNDFNYQNLHDAFLAPSGAHLLGTDQLGRD